MRPWFLPFRIDSGRPGPGSIAVHVGSFYVEMVRTTDYGYGGPYIYSSGIVQFDPPVQAPDAGPTLWMVLSGVICVTFFRRHLRGRHHAVTSAPH